MNLEMRMVPEYGVTLDGVWIPYEFLEELQEQEPLMSDFGHVLLAPGQDVRQVCEARGLLQVETRGGVCRGSELRAFMEGITFPG
jgi:hypothetical protein